MICFQFSIFELPGTTLRTRFAEPSCCDLLSIQYIWTTGNNDFPGIVGRTYVVICFQFSIFELPGTTTPQNTYPARLLWFAFNSVYLNYREQRSDENIRAICRCDLLSIQYIWTTGNNLNWYCMKWFCVVICFQFSIFELPGTTFGCRFSFYTLLWFAFNSVYLNYREQPGRHFR